MKRKALVIASKSKQEQARASESKQEQAGAGKSKHKSNFLLSTSDEESHAQELPGKMECNNAEFKRRSTIL